MKKQTKIIAGFSVAAVVFLSGCAQSDLQNNLTAMQKSAGLDSNQTVYARFVPERKDDFAFENDLVAFRKYGPALRDSGENAGVDCWSKRVEYPIINKWYKQHLTQDKSYHKDWGEGLDNYHVGSSAGCGSSALWIDNQWQALETYTKWEILEQTNDYVRFALTYQHQVFGNDYKEVKTIELRQGERLFKATSQFYKNGQKASGLPVAVGLATHDGKATVNNALDNGVISAWETLGDADLGTGIVVDPSRNPKFLNVKNVGVKDSGHAIYVLTTDANGMLEYYAGYGWQKQGVITDQDKWNQYLAEFATNTAKFTQR